MRSSPREVIIITTELPQIPPSLISRLFFHLDASPSRRASTLTSKKMSSQYHRLPRSSDEEKDGLLHEDPQSMTPSSSPLRSNQVAVNSTILLLLVALVVVNLLLTVGNAYYTGRVTELLSMLEEKDLSQLPRVSSIDGSVITAAVGSFFCRFP